MEGLITAASTAYNPSSLYLSTNAAAGVYGLNSAAPTASPSVASVLEMGVWGRVTGALSTSAPNTTASYGVRGETSVTQLMVNNGGSPLTALSYGVAAINTGLSASTVIGATTFYAPAYGARR